jgi:RimJ/RimL family protein N-acetyltransferase
MQGLRVEAALGYWLAEPYWHQGIMTEAAEAVLSHARRDLGIRRVWADYYEGNDPSRKVMERLGFHFHHIEKDRYIELLGERRTAVVQVKTM